MKSKFLLLLIIASFMSCKTAKDARIKGKKNYILPNQSPSISTSEVSELFPDLSDKYLPSIFDQLYSINNMLVGLSYRPNNPLAQSTKPFEYYKALYISLTRNTGEKVIDVSLKDFNSTQFIVCDYESKNDGFLEFHSFKTGDFNTYNGFIRYQKGAQKDTAVKLLADILKNLKVK